MGYELKPVSTPGAYLFLTRSRHKRWLLTRLFLVFGYAMYEPQVRTRAKNNEIPRAQMSRKQRIRRRKLGRKKAMNRKTKSEDAGRRKAA